MEVLSPPLVWSGGVWRCSLRGSTIFDCLSACLPALVTRVSPPWIETHVLADGAVTLLRDVGRRGPVAMRERDC